MSNYTPYFHQDLITHYMNNVQNKEMGISLDFNQIFWNGSKF